MNIPRLKRMIAVLEEVEAKHAGHFDMEEFFKSKAETGGHYRGIKARDAVVRGECGSTACALGWYVLFHPDENWNPTGDTLSTRESLYYFDIPNEDWSRLFEKEKGYETPRHVINRIREMIGEGV